MKKNRMKNALVCGMLGCLCYGGGDWLMLYGNPAHHGTLLWLTEGVAKIAQWRFNLAMALVFPGILLYGIALFALQGFITGERQRKVYHYLNAFSLTPWIALHLFYIMILTLFAWLNRNGFADDATAICEGLYAPLSWLVPVSEALMVPFQKRQYYCRAMQGSYSIKYVLPALFPDDPELDYHNLEGVHNGTEDSAAFEQMEKMTPEEQTACRSNLLKYCGVDTLAMVKVWQKLTEVIGNNP